ncbi:MAG: SIR2 family protein [Burkholderiaceae bacterium]|nr:SIR2 family protein [Burkholderiaceae bacterium]
MREVLWNSLVEGLQSGKCVLVLGPDIPASPRAPNAAPAKLTSARDTFCEYLACQLRDEGLSVGEQALFGVAQQYEDTPAFQSVKLKNIAAKFFRELALDPGPLHAELSRLPFPLVLTTCHDTLLQKALAAADKPAQTFSYHYRGEPRDIRELEEPPDNDRPTVYHLFGNSTNPDSLVLTENDLLDFIRNLIAARPKLPDSLKSHLRDKTFLFVGFGIRHWYIRFLLKLLIRALDLSTGAVALESLGEMDPREREQTVLFYRRGTRVEVVENDALSFLGELNERLTRSGGYLGPSKRRTRRAQVFISHERSDMLVAERVYQALSSDLIEATLDSHLLQSGDDWNQRLEDGVRNCDFFVVLNSENLVARRVGYVNKEIDLALDQARYMQAGIRFIKPICIGGLSPESGLPALRRFDQHVVRPESEIEDLKVFVSQLSRDFQLRMRAA